MQGLLTPCSPARALDNKLYKFLICYEKCFLLPKALRCSLRAIISGPGEHVLPLAGYMIKHHLLLSFKTGPHLSASTLPSPSFCCSLHLYIFSKTQGAQVIETLAWPCLRSFSGLSPCALADDVIGLLATVAHRPFPSAKPPFPS